MQAGRKTQRQAFHGLNKGLSLSNDPDLAKKREKSEERELDRAKEECNELEKWSSCKLDEFT